MAHMNPVLQPVDAMDIEPEPRNVKMELEPALPPASVVPPAQPKPLDLEAQKQIQQKLRELSDEIAELVQGTHKEFISRQNKLKQIREEKDRISANFRDLQMQIINAQYFSEIQQSKDDYENDVSQLRERMLNVLMDKQKRLEESHQDTGPAIFPEISIENYTATIPQANARKLRRRKDPSSDSNANRPQMLSITNYESIVNKKKKLPPVNINFSLTTDDIQDDLQSIAKKKY